LRPFYTLITWRATVSFRLTQRDPSQAVDVAPCPLQFPDPKSPNYQAEVRRFYYAAGYIKAVAFRLGINIRWGGDWDGDIDFSDNAFNDLPHFEIKV
jgi:peptidoglycan L-alanyl-D-glutamate endopeptidase CwlK